MALLLEQTLYNRDIVRYHRISSIDVNGNVVTATLDSFRNVDHRALPVAPLISRKFPFVYSDTDMGVFAAAYQAIKQLPEWSDSVDI